MSHNGSLCVPSASQASHLTPKNHFHSEPGAFNRSAPPRTSSDRRHTAVASGHGNSGAVPADWQPPPVTKVTPKLQQKVLLPLPLSVMAQSLLPIHFSCICSGCLFSRSLSRRVSLTVDQHGRGKAQQGTPRSTDSPITSRSQLAELLETPKMSSQDAEVASWLSLSHCVSLCLTVSHCLTVTLSHTVTHCRTVSLRRTVSHCVTLARRRVLSPTVTCYQ